MDFNFLVGGSGRKISVEQKDNKFVFREGQEVWEADIRPISENVVSLLIGGRTYTAYIGRDRLKTIVHINGAECVVEKPGEQAGDFLAVEEKAVEGKLKVKAPMPGKVIKIDVAEGDEVRKNQTLAVVEAMKMENEIKSPGEAVVTRVFVAAGSLVDSENPLLELEVKAQAAGT
jgi:biotin carboxyl carrier protein